MIKIVCLKWGTLYSASYVNNLYKGIKRNTKVPFEFYCFTEDATGLDSNVNVLPIGVDGLEGWWNKLYLYHPDNGLSGDILFFDLDTIIIDNIDEFLLHRSKFSIIDKGIFDSLPHEVGVVYNSTMMQWHHETMSYFWDVFMKNKEDMKTLRGDQDFFSKHIAYEDAVIFQKVFPGRIQSYKWNCYENGAPDGTSIVCFHGNPRPHEAASQTVKGYKPRAWVKQHWG